jgi:hypothetical protein
VLGRELRLIVGFQIYELEIELHSLCNKSRVVTSGLFGKLSLEVRGHGRNLVLVSGGQQNEGDGERGYRHQKTERREMDAGSHGVFLRRRPAAVRLPRLSLPMIIDDLLEITKPHTGADRARPIPRRPWFIFTLTLLIAAQFATPAHVGGRLGHRVITRLAEKHATPAAKAGVAALLEPGESLADASLWADQNRR